MPARLLPGYLHSPALLACLAIAAAALPARAESLALDTLQKPDSEPAQPAAAFEEDPAEASLALTKLPKPEAAAPLQADDLAAEPLTGETPLPTADGLVALRAADRPERWFADWQDPLLLPAATDSSQSQIPPLPRDRLPEAPDFPEPLAPEDLEPPLPDLAPPPEPPAPVEPVAPDIPEAIEVEQFQFVGSTIFSQEELAAVVADYVNQPLSFAQLLEARSRITEYYTQRGYITSGALIPPQEFSNSTVVIQIVEGRLQEIVVNGTRRLNPNYVRSRLAIATQPPLQLDRLREALQLLQLDPLIETLASELTAGTELGANRLIVRIVEADSFSASANANNNRSPSVGSLRRGVSTDEGNLLGLGDGISASYSNTDGSDSFDLSYLLPVNPRNGKLRLAFGMTASKVIEEPFNILDIRSNSRYYELGFRQPLWQTPVEEFAIGLNFSRQESETSLLGIPFPFPFTGADDNGQVRLSALRFYQEWTNRNEWQVLAARSQFSLGVDWFDATANPEPPDSNFFSWRGQGQWVRLLAPDALLVVRGDLQVGDRPLPSLERFGLGGQDTVRGYRQDTLLADNGFLASAELRWPILRWPEAAAVLQLAPFVDFGYGWNNSEDNPVETNAISSIGLGLRWQLGETLTARFDWGFPLTDLNTDADTWQENGLYFSIVVMPF